MSEVGGWDVDPEANTAYLRLSESRVSRTVEISKVANADVDGQGRLVGIELLYVPSWLMAVALVDYHKVMWRSHECWKPAGHKGPCKCKCGEMMAMLDQPRGEERDTARKASAWRLMFNDAWRSLRGGKKWT